ncbi:MAG: radical SAM family heme chaperone HemW [Clostridia bacterium]|nr:radical SAM family heme chaperone HemW [Clostridia bacterium]
MSKGGLYFHIPFCLKKCNYCDFCSFPRVTEERKEQYVKALLTEMEGRAEMARGTVFDTLFFGGGTPTLLSEDQLFRILNAAHRLFSVETEAEVTTEANPASAGEDKLREMRKMGFDRLSIGAQSFCDGELLTLGRAHTAEDAVAFYGKALAAGFENINLDLMYGIPGQTAESWQKTLAEAVSLGPAHISAYSLILEEGTPFYGRKETLALPTEEEEEAFHEALLETLAQNGYHHYEISNYARSGKACRHNLHYWRNEPYLGFGVSAYSFFDGERFGNGRDFSSYLSRPLGQTADRERLTEEALAYEWLMLRFRLSEGISLAEYQSTFGLSLKEQYAPLISKYTEMGLMGETATHLFLTEKGMRLSNAILVDFLA